MIDPTAIFALLRSKWTHYGILALVCLILWARGSVWESRAEAHKASYEQLVVDTREASEEATRLALEAKRKTETRYAELARQADAARADLQDMRARADRYAVRNRVSAACGGTTGGAPSTAGIGDPTGGDRPGDTPELVAIPREDFDLIGYYVERLTRVRGWGQTLKDEGFATVVGD